MCGIIGYTGKDNSVKHLIEGLRALEYRGYDSAGIAFFDNENRLCRLKAAGRLKNVEEMLGSHPETAVSHCGIGHTRWATHGEPSDKNSHPHGTTALQLVHNGIIENYADLRSELNCNFESDTDTEVAARLLDHLLQTNDKQTAIEKLLKKLRGSYAFGIVFADSPDKIYAVRKDSPLIIGTSDTGNFIASDITAILRYTRDYYQLDDDELAVISPDSIEITKNGVKVAKEKETAVWDIESAERGGYKHFMYKEINEEHEAIVKTLSPRIKNGLPDFSNEKIDTTALANTARLHIVACGTAMHAGLVAKQLFNKFAKLPTEVEVASEFRYADPIISKDDTVMIISQSGETADSLAALRLSKSKGANTIAIVNVIGSSIAREANSVVYTLAGPEIAVASTKAYSVQTALLTLLVLECGLIRKTISETEAKHLISELIESAPNAVKEMISHEDEYKRIAASISSSKDIFFIGRGIDSALCAEGSLKLKEISYIHSEAYAAGELKHGTISLITPGIPVIALCTIPELRKKMISNIREVKARGANVIAISDINISEANETLIIPKLDPTLAFLPTATALQLIAYHTADMLGCDIDKPRNLAKSVTVE